MCCANYMYANAFARLLALLLLAGAASHVGLAAAAGSDLGGHSRCRCIDPVDLGEVASVDADSDGVGDGLLVAFTDGRTNGAVSEVPVGYGSYCQAWDDVDGQEYYASCVDAPVDAGANNSNGTEVSAVKPDWCSIPWCFVDMCNCDELDMGSDSYMSPSRDSFRLGYSYATCDTTVEDPSAATAAYLADFCPSKYRSDCESDEGGGCSCTWTEKPMLIGITVVEVQLCVAASIQDSLKCVGCTGTDGCECITPADMPCAETTPDGTIEFSAPTSGISEVPFQYGSGCSAWDTADGMQYFADCLPSNNNPPSWCKDQWCYVDLCSCDAADAAPSSYFSGADGACTSLGYSYATCQIETDTTTEFTVEYCAGNQANCSAVASACKVEEDTGACVPKTSEDLQKEIASRYCGAGPGVDGNGTAVVAIVVPITAVLIAVLIICVRRRRVRPIGGGKDQTDDASTVVEDDEDDHDALERYLQNKVFRHESELTRREFEHLVNEELNLQANEALLDAIFTFCDADGNGLVEEEELMAFLAEEVRPVSSGRVWCIALGRAGSSLYFWAILMFWLGHVLGTVTVCSLLFFGHPLGRPRMGGAAMWAYVFGCSNFVLQVVRRAKESMKLEGRVKKTLLRFWNKEKDADEKSSGRRQKSMLSSARGMFKSVTVSARQRLSDLSDVSERRRVSRKSGVGSDEEDDPDELQPTVESKSLCSETPSTGRRLKRTKDPSITRSVASAESPNTNESNENAEIVEEEEEKEEEDGFDIEGLRSSSSMSRSVASRSFFSGTGRSITSRRSMGTNSTRSSMHNLASMMKSSRKDDKYEYMTANDLKAVLEASSVFIPSQLLSKLFKEIDDDRSGTISGSEMRSYLERVDAETKWTKRKMLMKRCLQDWDFYAEFVWIAASFLHLAAIYGGREGALLAAQLHELRALGNLGWFLGGVFCIPMSVTSVYAFLDYTSELGNAMSYLALDLEINCGAAGAREGGLTFYQFYDYLLESGVVLPFDTCRALFRKADVSNDGRLQISEVELFLESMAKKKGGRHWRAFTVALTSIECWNMLIMVLSGAMFVVCSYGSQGPEATLRLGLAGIVMYLYGSTRGTVMCVVDCYRQEIHLQTNKRRFKDRILENATCTSSRASDRESSEHADSIIDKQ